MSCNLNGNTITLSFIFANKPSSYIGGTPLSVTIASIINGPYAGEVGSFTISTEIKVDSKFYLQDIKKTNPDLVKTTPGLITKTSEVTASSYQASQENVIYTFSLST